MRLLPSAAAFAMLAPKSALAAISIQNYSFQASTFTSFCPMMCASPLAPSSISGLFSMSVDTNSTTASLRHVQVAVDQNPLTLQSASFTAGEDSWSGRLGRRVRILALSDTGYRIDVSFLFQSDLSRPESFGAYPIASNFLFYNNNAPPYHQATNTQISLAAAVPEPATWAMMIGGFGMVGGAMRSTRRKWKISVSYA